MGKKFHPTTQKKAYFFILPSLLILTIFVFIPLIASFVISLLNINIFMNNVTFAGIDNFKKMISDARISNSTFNTFYFTLLEVPLQVGMALLLTMFVVKDNKYTKALRTIYYLPFICSMTAIGIVWSMMLDPNLGMIPYFLKKAGLGTVAFLKDPDLAMPTVIGITAWKGFGYTLTILVAAVLSIPESQYEAAEMDGASTWNKFIKITIPSIMPTISFCIVTTAISSMQVFDQTYVMTQGGPLYRTETLVQYIYDRGFQTAPYDLGYASAISIYLFVIIAVITFILRKFVLNRGETENA